MSRLKGEGAVVHGVRGRNAGPDHRPRVARERRGRTRARILETALAVFAEKGPDAPRIDDFIRAAGIARGTFYNYYRSTDELLRAATHALEDGLIASIEAELEPLDDPLDRLAGGILLWLGKAHDDPLWCRFVVRVRSRAAGVERELGNDLRDAMKAGLIRSVDLRVARDLVVGTILEAMARMIDERVPARYARDVAQSILLGLGAQRRRVEALVGAGPRDRAVHRRQARARTR
ncbi:MAG: TetR/AcrR family transcriptional regulator [Rhodospirillaceae bacterium]